MKTVVVTVPPTGFADTVTPPSFSPAAEVMVPLRMASAALAPAARLIAAAVMAISVASRTLRGLVMTLSPVGSSAQRAGLAGAGGVGIVFRYATIASICAGSKWYLKPGMRGVPLLMTSRITASCPPDEFCDSWGP